MAGKLLFVGSVPLEDAEVVMTSLAGEYGSALQAIPDGETGERRSWVNRLCYQVFSGHPDLETIKRPRPEDGVERLLPRDRNDAWQFKVRQGVERVRFGNPGFRLAYAKEAAHSYFVFRTLREKGLIPRNLRFQVSIPMVNSVVRPLYFPHPGDLERLRPGYEEALAAEIEAMLQRIPHEDLAIQWDCAWEVVGVNDLLSSHPAESDIATHTAPIARLSQLLPEEVDLGFHFCFGTFGGWPSFAPAGMSRTVELVNAVAMAVERRIDWVHLPLLNRSDDAYYAPLGALNVRSASIYLGLIHSRETLEERIKAASRHLMDFGVAAYCGFGRTSPAEIPAIMKDHHNALKIVRSLEQPRRE